MDKLGILEAVKVLVSDPPIYPGESESLPARIYAPLILVQDPLYNAAGLVLSAHMTTDPFAYILDVIQFGVELSRPS